MGLRAMEIPVRMHQIRMRLGRWESQPDSNVRRDPLAYNGSCVPNPGPEWARRGYKVSPENMPDYNKGRRTEREEGLLR
jgi:hypothetical protein